MPRPLRRSLALTLGLVALALAGCDGAGGTSAGPSGTPSAVITASSPTPTAPVKPPKAPNLSPSREGPPGGDCVEGWVMPREGDKLFDYALRVLRSETRWRGTFVVHDMRYFTGPESPPEPDKGYLRIVQRWYLRGYLRSDPALQGRFLIERRRFGSGLAAVAPYDSRGWSSPDWIGFQYDTVDTEERTYPGLPGAWAGIPYDFVKGGEGVDVPGLPAEVVGCLDGT